MSFETRPMGARLGISGVLEFKDKDGNVLERVQMHGSVPIADLDISDDHKQTLTAMAAEASENAHGTDHRQ